MKFLTAFTVAYAIHTADWRWLGLALFFALWEVDFMGRRWIDRRERLVAARKPWPDAEDGPTEEVQS